MILVSNQAKDDIHVNDQYIDDLMERYGYEWNEPNMEYVNGDKTVSGDFASEMAKRIKKLEADRSTNDRKARIKTMPLGADDEA